MTLRKLFGIFLLTTAGVGFLGGMVMGRRLATNGGSPVGVEEIAQAQTPAPMPTRQGTAPAYGVMPDLSSVAEAALKAAANISSTNVVRRQNPWAFWFDDVPMYQQSQSQSLGSGVVVSSDGLVLTNTHVIGSARADVKVTLSTDGRERPGKIVGIDDLSDLAVVKVDGQNLA